MLLADAVGVALDVILDTLQPAERLALVLHDMFDVPFDDIECISVMGFTVAGGHIAEVTALVNPDRLRRLDLSALGSGRG